MAPPGIVFFGYSEVGHDCLTLLLERGDNVVALITHQDSPTEKIWFRTPAAAAHARGIPVFTPHDVNTPEWIERVVALGPDLILSAYYRHMISMKIIARARLGAFNLHGSLLPRYRGRAPINWAVLHGESHVGMTLHRMVKRADAGAIVDREGVEIGPRDNAEEAFRKVLPCARRILGRQIDALLAGTAKEIPQDESQATCFGKRTPEDGRIAWTQSSVQIFNLIRAVTDPYPGAFTDVERARLIVWWAEIDSSAVRAVLRQRRAVAEAGVAVTASPASSRWSPGDVLSIAPLVVATADGAIELTKTEWQGGSGPGIQVGHRL